MAQGGYLTHDPSCLLSEEPLLCPICLEAFNDPVTSPCGHNFCKNCLTQCWNSSELCFCPICKEKYTKRPEVKINIALREIVEQFKRKCTIDEPEILCNYCIGTKLKALKSCLDCGVTLCMSHLESHNQVPKFQKHKLINAVKNLADYICQKHEKPLVMFCCDDQMCVCEFCPEGDHRNHTIIHIGEETGKRKTHLGKTKTKVQQLIRDRLMKIQEIKQKMELCRKSMETETAGSVDIFTSLIYSIERTQDELFEVMEENQKSVKRQAKGYIKDLEQEITVLKRRDTELGKLLDSDDHIHLLQIYLSVYSVPVTNNWPDIWMDNGLGVRSLWAALTQLQETLNKTVEEIGLKMVRLDAVDVTLDPDTANAHLILSCNLKEVKYTPTANMVLDTPERFSYYYIVLGKQGFSTGRFYFEVQVSGKTMWDLGVVRESVNRKEEIMPTPENGFWAICLKNEDEYWTCTDPENLISQGNMLQNVGVLVDYEKGLVSFYDVEARCHIHSFIDQSFTGKVFPFINPGFDDNGKNSAPIIITHLL